MEIKNSKYWRRCPKHRTAFRRALPICTTDVRKGCAAWRSLGHNEWDVTNFDTCIVARRACAKKKAKPTVVRKGHRETYIPMDEMLNKRRARTLLPSIPPPLIEFSPTEPAGIFKKLGRNLTWVPRGECVKIHTRGKRQQGMEQPSLYWTMSNALTAPRNKSWAT